MNKQKYCEFAGSGGPDGFQAWYLRLGNNHDERERRIREFVVETNLVNQPQDGELLLAVWRLPIDAGVGSHPVQPLLDNIAEHYGGRRRVLRALQRVVEWIEESPESIFGL